MGKYTPVSAAEKYAEWGADRPRCKCHGELVHWYKGTDRPAGGHPVCFIKTSARDRSWKRDNPDLVAAGSAKSYARYKEVGLCIRCGKERDGPSTICQRCLGLSRDWKRLNR